MNKQTRQKNKDLVINVGQETDGVFISQPAPKERRRIEWSLINKHIYINPKFSRLPRFVAIILVVLIICTLMFVIRPRLVKRQPAIKNNHLVDIGELKVDGDARVITSETELFSAADKTSAIQCSLLLNEHVKIKSAPKDGFLAVETDGGLSGFIASQALAVDHSESVESERIKDVYIFRGPKRVMSDARSGNTLLYLHAGTKLWADYQNEGLLRLILPDGRRGWINDDNVQVVEPEGKILHPAAVAPEQYFLSAALMFNQATYMPHGLSYDGIDMPGVIYIAGLLNNIQLPRTLEGIAQAGSEIQIVREKDEPSFDALEPGDVIVFGDGHDMNTPKFLGVLIEDKRVLINPLNESVIREYDLNYDNALRKKVISARRIFS